jgi:hypothetical protein
MNSLRQYKNKIGYWEKIGDMNVGECIYTLISHKPWQVQAQANSFN